GALPERDAARAVQEEERPSLTGLEHLDGRAAGAEREEASLRRRGRHQAAAVRSAIRRTASLCVPGTTRSSLGSAFGPYRSSYSATSGLSSARPSSEKR